MDKSIIESYPRYDSYKDSGEQWIGEIPSEWGILKLKQIFHEKKHTQNMNLSCGSISYGEVVRKNDDSIPESTKRSYQEVLEGEFLINPLNLNYDLISLRIALSEINVVVSAGYIVIKEHLPICRDYFKYLLHRYDVAYMKLLGSGVRQTINFNHISNSLLPVPSIDTQRKIASFLNKKTDEINRAIELKQQQISMLEEYKQIVIQNAVTKGLNPDVPMKDSGIDWIGDIPEHWGMKKGKWLFLKMDRPVREDDRIVTCFRDGEVTLRSNRRTEGFTNALKEHGYQGVRKGDLVIHQMDAFAGAIGISDSDGKSTPVYSVCTPKDCNEVSVKYYVYLLRGLAYNGFILSLAKGIRERSTDFRFKDFSSLELPLPPYKTQLAISEFIEEKIAQINLVIENNAQQIDRLKEYKTVLINKAVTGKIKVA